MPCQLFLVISYMLNLRQFSRPNPSDIGMHHRGGEALGMPKHSGAHFYHNTHKHPIVSTKIAVMLRGGITTLREPKHASSSNSMYSALVNAPIHPRISHLVDARLLKRNPLIQSPNSSI